MALYLTGTLGDQAVTWKIEAPLTTLGRSSNCDIHLADASVSRRHAEIARRGVTVLVAEQYARPVLPIIDRGYVIENGSLVVSGTGPELMQNPEVKSAYFGV